MPFLFIWMVDFFQVTEKLMPKTATVLTRLLLRKTLILFFVFLFLLQGCFEKVEEWLDENKHLLGTIGMVILVVQVGVKKVILYIYIFPSPSPVSLLCFCICLVTC